jgi:hypothetical protein
LAQVGQPASVYAINAIIIYRYREDFLFIYPLFDRDALDEERYQIGSELHDNVTRILTVLLINI